MNETPASQPVQDASQRLQSFVATHGRVPVTILCGGAASTLGTIVPFAHVSGVFGGGSSYSIIQAGFYGLLLLVVAVVLGIFPIFLKQYLRFTLLAFGVACAFFGIFFAMWLASSGLASMLGSGLGGFSGGFYLNLFGYAAMVAGYYMLQNGTEASNA